MDYIQVEAMNKSLEDDKERMMKQTEEQLQKIELNYDKINQKEETNQTSKTEYIKELELFRSRISAMFDSLMEKSFGEMNEKFDQNTKYTESMRGKLVRFEGRLKNLKQQLNSATTGKEALIYISLQRGKELMEDITKELSTIDFSIKKENFKPVIDDAIEEYVKGLEQIAVVEDEQMRQECISSEWCIEEVSTADEMILFNVIVRFIVDENFNSNIIF
jgi:hypothetical protein